MIELSAYLRERTVAVNLGLTRLKLQAFYEYL
jgi:hypothetical protein